MTTLTATDSAQCVITVYSVAACPYAQRTRILLGILKRPRSGAAANKD